MAARTVVTMQAAATAHLDIFLAAGDPFVVGYPCLPWRHHAAVGGTPAQASLPHFVAIRVWILRSSIGPAPADLATARLTSVLTAAFTAAAWSRWLTELAASGLLAKAPFDRLRDSDTAMATLTLADPTRLDILAADFHAAETFDIAGIPGVAAIAAARGRRAHAAVPAVLAVSGPAELRFLELCKLDRLSDPVLPGPLIAFGRLCGMLGPVSTQAVRADALSTVRISAVSLRAYMTRALGIEAAAAATAASDPALAVSLVEHVLSAYDALTDVLAPKVVTETALRAEAADAFRFVQGTNEDRTGIIIRRLRFVEDRLPACHSWPTSGLSPPSPIAVA